MQNEARKLNHQEVVEEDKRLKLPSNWEAKKSRLEWELAEDEKKKVFSVFSTMSVIQYCVQNIGSLLSSLLLVCNSFHIRKS